MKNISTQNLHFFNKRGKIFFLLLFSFFLTTQSNAADFFWVGGTGNWNAFATHWATTSGGAVFRTNAPTAADNVFFDANSGAAGYTVTLNVVAVANNFTFSGNAFSFNAVNTLTINGTSTNSSTQAITFAGASPYTFVGNFTAAASTSTNFSNTNLSSFGNVTIGAGSTFRFSSFAGGTASVSGTFTPNGNCTNPVTLSATGAFTAPVNFTNPQTWSGVNVSQINSTGANVTVNSITVVVTGNFTNNTTAGRTLFWVGGTGNWSDPAHWSLASGGTGGECIPTTLDNVNFDAASFTLAGQTVTIDADGACRNMNWTGVTNTPTLAGAAVRELTITGSLTLAAAMTQTGNAPTFEGQINFITSAGQNITTFGKGLNRVQFQTAAAGSWTLQDAFLVRNQTLLISGELDTNNENFTSGTLSVNTVLNPARTLSLGASTVTLTSASTTVLDLRGNDANFTLNSATSTVIISGVNAIVETGTFSKILPNLNFTGTGNRVINTGSDVNTIIFKLVTVSNTGTFTINGTSPKEYDAITIGNTVTGTINGVASDLGNVVNGNILLGTGGNMLFNGGYDIGGNITTGTGNTLNFGTTAGNNNFGGTVTIGNTGAFLAGGAKNNTFVGAFTLGTGATTTFSNTPAASTNSFSTINMNGGNTFRFSSVALSTVSGTINVSGSCATPVTFTSNIPPTQARLQLATALSLVGATVQNINATTQPINVSNGTIANITNVTGNATSRSLFWVHSVAGANSIGNWSDPANWSLTSGGMTGECPPTIYDNVRFDAGSFTAANQIVDMNVNAFCRNMDWTGGTVNTPRLQSIGSDTDLTVGGNLLLVTNLTVGTGGTNPADIRDIYFAATNALTTPVAVAATTNNTINLGLGTNQNTSARRFRNAYFNQDAAMALTGTATWTLASAFNLTQNTTGTNGTLQLIKGNLTTNNFNVQVNVLNANGANGTLTIGNSQVVLRGVGLTFDFRNDTNLNFVIPGATSFFSLTNNVAVSGVQGHTGSVAKEMPNIIVTANTNVTINTGNGSGEITFRNIDLQQNNVLFNLTGTCEKTYTTALTFNTGINATFDASTANSDRSEFQGAITFGTNSQANFIGQDEFQSTFTVAGTTGAGIRFTGTGRKRFTGNVSLGNNSLFSLQNTSAPPNSFTTVTVGSGSTWQFSTAANSTVSGLFTINSDCLAPTNIQSSTAGNQANVAFDINQTWDNVNVRDINETGAGTVTVSSGTDAGNNANIVFTVTLRTLYWVHSVAGGGSTGNWNDPNNWSLTSGGATGECPPTLNDDVFFDAASFSAAGQIVNIDVNAQTRDMTWTGATGTPILQGTAAFNLQMGGSVTLIPAMNITFLGESIFRNTKTGTNTITSAGQSFKGTTTFYDNTLGTGIWQLADNFETTDIFNLVDGTFTTSPASHQLKARIIDAFVVANGVGDPTRELNLNSSIATATRNIGRAVDFRGNSTNFVLNSTATSELHIVGVGDISLEMGSAAKTIPNLFIDNAGAGNTIDINSSDIENNANRITFRNITAIQDGLVFNVNGNAPKTYGNITFPNQANADFRGIGNTPPTALADRNLFNGTINFGQNTRIDWFDDNVFDAPVNILSTTGNGNAVYMQENNHFTANAPLTFLGVGQARWSVGGAGNRVNEFLAPVNLLSVRNVVSFYGNAATEARFRSTLFIQSSLTEQAVITFNPRPIFHAQVEFGEAAGGNNSNPVSFVRGADFSPAPAGTKFITGIDSRVTVAASDATASIFRDMQIGENNILTFNDDLTVDNMVLSRFDVINFPNSDLVTPALNSGRTIITGFLTARSLLCSEWINIRSNLTTVRAEIDFQNAHLDAANRSLLYTFIQDINNIGGNVVEASPDPIVNVSNNLNITFIGATLGTTYFWVGGSGDWSELAPNNHWAYISGGAPSGCIPTPNDIVIFDELSFNSNNDIVTLDNFFSYCKDMIWRDEIFTTSGFAPRLRGDDLHVLQIFGDLRFPDFTTPRPDWNEFRGLTQFKGTSTPETKTLEFNGSRFFGPVQFDSPADTWTIVDDMRVEGGGRADITFSYGRVEAGANTISLEDNWVVDVPTGTLPQALFVAQTSTVTFNGDQDAQVDVRDFQSAANCLECSDQSAATSQLRGCSGSPFYNVVVDKRYNRILELRSTINIYNNFSILVGNVEDDGWQIRGNTTGTVNIADNTRLVLGQNNDATAFPTCYPAANITIGDGTPNGRMNASLIPDDPTLTAPNLKASIVEYICPDAQLVRGGITYGTLYLRSAGVGNNIKRFTNGNVTINGSFIIDTDQLVYDMGYQIRGNSFNEGNTFQMLGNSQLILGTNQDITERTYVVARAQPGLIIPAPVAADIATTFPKFTVGNGTFGDGIFSNTKVSLNANSTVIYNANANQEVAGGITYGNIILRATGATIGTPKLKTITLHNAASTGVITIATNALVESFNHFIDDGYQITGNGTGTFTGQANSKLILGNATVTGGTNFPSLFTRTNISLDPNDHETIYNADVAQLMSTEPNYGNVTLTAPTSTGATLIEKRFRRVGTPSVLATAIINGNLTINPRNHLIDEGNQITGLAPKSVTMNSNAPLGESMLTIGTNGATDIASQFPLTFGTIVLNDLTTVIYNTGSSLAQNVRGTGLNGAVGGTNSYYNLIIQSGNEAIATKNLQATMRVRNNFTIRTGSRFVDNNRQVIGSVLATGFLTMEAASEMYVGLNTTATRIVFPTNYTRARINLNTTSVVRYQSRRITATLQQVSSEPIYGDLFLTSNNGSAGANITMQIAPTPVGVTNTTLTVARTLTVDYRVRFEDMGLQIIGNASAIANNLLVRDGSELVVGTATRATLFPTLYPKANINLSHLSATKSTVIYNSGVVGNNISAEPNYGNVTLTNAAVAGTVTKTLLGTTDIFGNLLIQTRNNLDATVSNHQINLRGNWTCQTGGTFDSRSGKVVLNGTALQQVTTNTQKFFQLQADNTSSSTNGIQMIDNITIKTGGQTIFNTGLFFPVPTTNKMIFEENATVGGAGTYTLGGWITTTAPALSANGPSNISHVVGRVEKQGTDAFMFPIGNGVNYAPAGLSARGNSTTSFEARYVGPRLPTTDGYDVSLKEPGIYAVSNLEYWLIDKLTPAAENAFVYLSWDNPRSVVFLPSSLKALRWNGALWTDNFLGGYSNSSARGIIASQTAVSTFSPWTLGTFDQFNPLPLDLLSFDAKIEGESVKVTWETTNEIDNSHFMVERSQDSNSFGSLGRVDAKGTGLEGTFNYQFWDVEPFSGLSYYRLKMFDLNGDFKYSPVRSVLFEKIISGIKGEISLYPNPNGGARFYLTLDGKLTTDAQIEIVDMVGRIVHKQDVQKGGYDIVITPMRVLPAGTYILRFVTPIESITKKFVVE